MVSKTISMNQSSEPTLREINLSHDKNPTQEIYSLPINEIGIQKNDMDSGGRTIKNSSLASFNKMSVRNLN